MTKRFLSVLEEEHRNDESRFRAVPTLGPMQMISEYVCRDLAPCGVVDLSKLRTSSCFLYGCDYYYAVALPHNRFAVVTRGGIELYTSNVIREKTIVVGNTCSRHWTPFGARTAHNLTVLICGPNCNPQYGLPSRRSFLMYDGDRHRKVDVDFTDDANHTCIDVTSDNLVVYYNHSKLQFMNMASWLLQSVDIGTRHAKWKISPVDDSLVIHMDRSVSWRCGPDYSTKMHSFSLPITTSSIYDSGIAIDADNNLIVHTRSTNSICVQRQDGTIIYNQQLLSPTSLGSYSTIYTAVLSDGRVIYGAAGIGVFLCTG